MVPTDCCIHIFFVTNRGGGTYVGEEKAVCFSQLSILQCFYNQLTSGIIPQLLMYTNVHKMEGGVLRHDQNE